MKLSQKVVLFYNNQQGGTPAEQYAASVLATSPVAYWKLNEGSGSAIVDSSGNGYDGSYTGVTWDGETFLGQPVPFWDGANDYGDVYSAGLQSAFDFDEGCVLIWVKVANAGVWTDSTSRYFFNLFADADNRILATRASSDNQLQILRSGDGTLSSFLVNSLSYADWFSVLLSWSVANDESELYINGVQSGSTLTGLVAASNTTFNTSRVTIGALSTTPSLVMHGYLAQYAVWDSPVDASKLALATV